MISIDEIKKQVTASLSERHLSRVLILPPDATRLYSGAGLITNIIYNYLKDNCQVDIMPALGTHDPMTRDECLSFFGDIPEECFFVHNWKTDVVKIGEVPSSFVSEVSEGLVEDSIDVEVNRRLLDPSYDLIISIGQVVPHEVVGMANYSKNIFVGCGGKSMINSSHMLGAFYGMERIMGKDFSPVRKVFDYAHEHFLSDLPLLFMLTVTTNEGDRTDFHGLFIGNTRSEFEKAVTLSQRVNLIHLDSPIKKAVVYLDPREFRSTWLGNKAIYRTRMAVADGGQVIIIAPGVKKFGEDIDNDLLIRKYGYVGREKILEDVKNNADLKENLSVAAHLIHGSSDGRFRITYCTRDLTEDEVRNAGFDYMPYDEAVSIYGDKAPSEGYVSVNGEDIYYISNPALGLWTCDNRSGK